LRKAIFLLITVTALRAGAAAGDCQGLDWTRPDVSSQQLRELAGRCDDLHVSRLMYNRAYHLDLLGRYQAVLKLSPGSHQEDVKNYHAYRIFIGLTEALTAYGDRASRGDGPAAWLNSVYDRATEIAELRIKGYDLQADRLEREAWGLAPSE
jgi:hypothetical protein